MWRKVAIGSDGRGIVWCASVFLAGNALGGAIRDILLRPDGDTAGIGFASAAVAALIAACITLISFASAGQKRSPEWAAILLCFALLGIQPKISNPDGRSAGIRTGGRRITATAAKLSAKLELLTEGCGEDELAVLKALSVGDKSALSREVKRNFRASGATHLLALSGLHVGIIYKLFGAMFAILGGAPVAKRIRSLLTITFLWWFAVITGLSPSIFRAVMMITIYELGSLIGRRSNGLNSLAASAIIITLINPDAPSELSFQMSFCACLSIFTIFPRLNAMMQTKLTPVKYIWDCATLAISCQMTTGMIAWAEFGTFPEYFIITNLLTVPLVAVIMYLLFAAAITSGIPKIGGIAAAALVRATELLNLITETIAGL